MSNHCPRVLLVGWSGADWAAIHPLLDAGKLPVLQSLVERGTMARPATPLPLDPVPLWTTIATGYGPERHGVYQGRRMIDGTSTVIGSDDWELSPFWNTLSQEGKSLQIYNWPASHPAKPIKGIFLSDRPHEQGAIFPERMTGSLADFEIQNSDLDGEVLKMFVPLAEEVDQEHDDRLAVIAKILARNFSVHNAVTAGLEEGDWDFAAVCYPAIQKLAMEFADCQLPLKPGSSEEDIEIFGGVMENAYRLHDAMLGRLLDLTGENVAVMVVSENGFRQGEDTPDILPDTLGGMAAWRKGTAFFLAVGEGISADSIVHGSRLQDLGPTILGLFGLAHELPGRDLFGESEKPSQRASVADKTPLGDDLNWEWNRVRYLMAADQSSLALLLLDAMHERKPERDDFRVMLITALLKEGMPDEAADLFNGSLSDDGPYLSLLKVSRFRQIGELEEGHEILCRIFDESHQEPSLLTRLALALVTAQDFKRAEKVFEQLPRKQVNQVSSLAGRAYCRCRLGDPVEGESLARKAISISYDFAWGHFVLALAFSLREQQAEALRALDQCLALDPNLPPARSLYLSLLQKGETETISLEHRPAAVQEGLAQNREQFLIERERRALEDRGGGGGGG